MNIKIEVKVKMGNGKEITLNNDEAKELYFKLKELYDNSTTIISYPIYTPPYAV